MERRWFNIKWSRYLLATFFLIIIFGLFQSPFYILFSSVLIYVALDFFFLRFCVDARIEIIKDDEIRKILGHLLTQFDNAVYEKAFFVSDFDDFIIKICIHCRSFFPIRFIKFSTSILRNLLSKKIIFLGFKDLCTYFVLNWLSCIQILSLSLFYIFTYLVFYGISL